eukprot:m.308315 g.308315  ORF g.308315 m.308315 type:complete len:351 (+) comp43746_c0_seq1:72-1124(+)
MKAFLAFLTAFVLSVAAKRPAFSWETVPVYNHLCNKSGAFSDETARFLARFPLVTIEKGQGSDVSDCCAEDKIIAAAKQVKAVNSSVYTIFYYNSVLDWNQYRLHQEFLKHPDYWLKNASGDPVRIPGDGTFKQPKDGMLVFDFSQDDVRKFWASDCLNATKTGYIDGCFADRANEESFRQNNLTTEKAKAYAAGHVEVLQYIQKNLGDGVIIANNDLVPGVGSTMIEGFEANEESIQHLQEAVAQGKLVQAHAGYGQDGSDNRCQNITNSLAAFLIGAGEYSYYGCSRGWFVDADHMDWLTWHPEYDKPLGKPMGQATKAGSVYSRRFSSGTAVTFDAKTNEGSIKWAH